MSVSGVLRGVRLLVGGSLRCPPALAPTSRCVSQAASQPQPSQDLHEGVNPTFRNRNPRNLEQMALAVKDRGWKTSWPQHNFYHRLEFNRSQHHVTAEVFSSSSPVPVLTCSSREWALKKQLPSLRCVAACQAVGEVLALRCQQAGITRMSFRMLPWAFRSDAAQAFRTALKEGGVVLSEPRRRFVKT